MWGRVCDIWIKFGCGRWMSRSLVEATLLLLPQGNIFKRNINVVATALCHRSVLALTSEVFIVSDGSPAIILHPSTLKSAVKPAPLTLHAMIVFKVSAVEQWICQVCIFYNLVVMMANVIMEGDGEKKVWLLPCRPETQSKESIIWFMSSPVGLGGICFTEERQVSTKEKIM